MNIRYIQSARERARERGGRTKRVEVTKRFREMCRSRNFYRNRRDGKVNRSSYRVWRFAETHISYIGEYPRKEDGVRDENDDAARAAGLRTRARRWFSLVRIPRAGPLYITLEKRVVESTPPPVSRSKKSHTDPRRQITEAREHGPHCGAGSLSFQVRCARCRALRAFVRRDICFLLRRTYAPRRIYISHRNRPAARGGRLLLIELGQVLEGARGGGQIAPRARARFDLRKRVVSPRLRAAAGPRGRGCRKRRFTSSGGVGARASGGIVRDGLSSSCARNVSPNAISPDREGQRFRNEKKKECLPSRDANFQPNGRPTIIDYPSAAISVANTARPIESVIGLFLRRARWRVDARGSDKVHNHPLYRETDDLLVKTFYPVRGRGGGKNRSAITPLGS